MVLSFQWSFIVWSQSYFVFDGAFRGQESHFHHGHINGTMSLCVISQPFLMLSDSLSPSHCFLSCPQPSFCGFRRCNATRHRSLHHHVEDAVPSSASHRWSVVVTVLRLAFNGHLVPRHRPPAPYCHYLVTAVCQCVVSSSYYHVST